MKKLQELLEDTQEQLVPNGGLYGTPSLLWLAEFTRT